MTLISEAIGAVLLQYPVTVTPTPPRACATGDTITPPPQPQQKGYGPIRGSAHSQDLVTVTH